MSFRRVFFTLLTFWCAVWPVLIVWATTSHNLVVAVASFIVTAVTPIFIFTRMRSWVEERHVVLEQLHEEHKQCHVEFDNHCDRLHVLGTFRGFEMAAMELDLLAESVARVDRGSYLDPGVLAVLIDERARFLRSVAPEPPNISIQALIRNDEEP